MTESSGYGANGGGDEGARTGPGRAGPVGADRAPDPRAGTGAEPAGRRPTARGGGAAAPEGAMTAGVTAPGAGLPARAVVFRDVRPFGSARTTDIVVGWITDVRLDEELTDCYRVAAHGGADVMGLLRADLRAGAPADFVLVAGECLPQVVVDMPRRDLVVHGGVVVARDGVFLDRR
ncbi:hypothetical protein [Streptomyces sp.]|uniref:hypothetical protein n=1 Tax=Streptomyces sp. TaxID=1931 RepID=UPI0035C7025E